MSSTPELQDAPDDTSLQVFRKFIKYLPDGTVQSRGVISKECYAQWLKTRRVEPGKPKESFRRVLTAHVRGSDGRKPFHREEEESLLVELRKKRIWPAFDDTPSRIGINGFRAVGYHERNSLKQGTSNDVSKRSEPNLPNLTGKGSFNLGNLSSNGSVSIEAYNQRVGRHQESVINLTKAAMLEDTAGRSKFLSSYEVFVMFAPADSTGRSRILGLECYETWVKTRRNGVKNAEHSFRKALIAHLCGRDGRRPFPRNLESLVIKELRRRETWPCFVGRKEQHVLNIGKKGFRHLGFHETKEKNPLAAGSVLKSKPKKKILTPEASNTEMMNENPANILISNPNFTPQPVPTLESLNSMLGTKRSNLSLNNPNPFVPAPGLPINELFSGNNLQPDNSWNLSLRRSLQSPTQPQSRKRPRLILPTFYVNNIDDHRNINNVMCYDGNMEMVSKYDLSDSDNLKDENNLVMRSSENCQYDEDFFKEMDNNYMLPFNQLWTPESELGMLPSFPSPEFFSSIDRENSILETFEDVSAEEVIQVLTLKKATEQIFFKHFNCSDVESIPKDVGGDVKLLRIIRNCRGDLGAAIEEVRAYLAWRESLGLEEMRNYLVDNNMSFTTLRKELTIGKRGMYPFFSQDESGDVTDIWILCPQTDDSSEQMEKDFLSHAKLCEFRSIVLDRLSRINRKVVGFKVIYDWTLVKDLKEDEQMDGKYVVGWFYAIRKWEKYLKKILEMYLRWHGGTCSRAHIFGNGTVFQMLTTTVAKRFLGIIVGGDVVEFCQKQKDYESLLRERYGDQTSWPNFVEGGKQDPVETELANTKLSTLERNLKIEK